MGPQPNGCGKVMGDIVSQGTGSLQWGRSRMAAESRELQPQAAERVRASMGPQPNGCGKGPLDARNEGIGRASMGPQPNGCGKSAPRLRR